MSSFFVSYGQNLILDISAKDSLNTILVNSFHFQKNHSTKKALLKTLDSVKSKFEKSGFFNVRLDTLIKKDSIYTAFLDLGKSRKLLKIYYATKDLDKKQLIQITKKVTDDFFELDIRDLPHVLNQLVLLFEKDGHSFVEIYLSTILLKDTTIEATLNIDKTKIRKIDKVIVNGYSNFSSNFLKHYLELTSSTLFNSEKLNEISKRVNSLPFASELKPPEVLFTKDSTILYLNLKRETANKFDGLIGFTSKETSGGLLFNGYLDLALHNVFNQGASLFLFWKSNGNERQVFNLSTSMPYVFNSKFSPNIDLNIYKQDSTFVNSSLALRVPYQLNSRNAIGLSLEIENSTNLLNNNTFSIEDYENLFYGINYNYRILGNYKLFESKFHFNASVLKGYRKLLNEKINQSKINLKGNYLWNLNFKNHIFLQNETGLLLSDKFVINELFRIGGVQSIRGFDEQSILASAYSFFNVEYRYLANSSSYLYSLIDFGYVNNEAINQSTQIFALGLGYAFETKFGFLNLSYALGADVNSSIDFKNSRFHLKISTFF